MVVKKWTKVLMCVVLSFMFLFTTVGYAALTSSLEIEGYNSFSSYEGIFITSVEVVGTPTNASSNSVSHIEYTTTQASSFTHTSRYYDGTITYKITVRNNTDYKYAYVGLSYNSTENGYNGNTLIGTSSGITITTKDNQNDTTATFNASDIVEPRTERVFYATYNLGTNVGRYTVYNTLVNYRFGKYVDSQDAAADAVLVRFGKILNDTSANGAYNTLITKIDDKYDGTAWKANFIGNVVGAHNDDTETINELFGDDLNMMIDGKLSNLTVLIKRENLDNNENTGDDYTAKSGYYSVSASGCEMTIYMTTEPLNVSWARPTVYVAVFTCDNNNGVLGEWRMIGDVYKGDAGVVGYTGNTTSTNTGSFSTDDWFANAATYTINAGSKSYQYSVREDETIETIMQVKSDTALKATLDSLIAEAEEAIRTTEIAGPVLVELRMGLAEATEFADSYVQGTTIRAEVIPVIRELDKALTAFRAAEDSIE